MGRKAAELAGRRGAAEAELGEMGGEASGAVVGDRLTSLCVIEASSAAVGVARSMLTTASAVRRGTT